MEDTSSIGLIEHQISVLIRRATFTNRKFGGLDRAAYLLLCQLQQHGPVGVKALADEFHLDISTVSRQTTGMVNEGYIRKIPVPNDKRASYFEITELGLAKLNLAKHERTARFTDLLHDWSLGEQQLFGEFLLRLNHAIIDG